MTATAQPSFGLEVANADAMDMLSDSGYNLGDRDIDFDLGSANGDQAQQDDALSLQDAGTDGGTQDDFMVDKDDLIEEDEIDYDDLELEDAAQNSPVNSVHVQTINESEALVDAAQEVAEADEVVEDLIDYSDVEGEAEEQDRAAAQPLPTTVQINPGDDRPPSADDQQLAPSKWEGSPQGGDYVIESKGDESYINDEDEDQSNDAFNPESQDVTNEYEDKGGSYDNPQRAELKGGQPHESLEEPDVPQVVDSDHEVEATRNDEHQSHTEVAEKQDQHLEQDRPLHPVTINYDGSELWLFKPHDGEEGEWLLSDEFLATQQFPYLFHACRAQLGDDLSNETELGLRFDNFHGFELFEDCTACAYTTLKDLLDCYLRLHAQDGNTDPESFYISLQFRPRVLTLVNELKKAVDDQVGFAGFNNAVASGKSSFTPAFSNVPGGPYDDHWGEEEGQEQAHDESYEEDKNDAMHQPNERNPRIGHTNSFTEDAEDVKDGQSSNGATNEIDGQSNAPPPREDVLNIRSSSASGSHQEDEEPAEDLIDYSDEEAETDDAKSGPTPANESSSASSTVQGDEIQHAHTSVGDETNTIETYENDRQSGYEHDSNVQHNSNEHGSIENVHAEFEGDDADRFAYPDDQAFDEAFDEQSDPELAPQAHEYDHLHVSAPGHHEGEVDEGSIHETGLAYDSQGISDEGVADGTLHTSAEDENTGIDDFLDLTGGVADAINDDPSGFLNAAVDDIGYYDDEDTTELTSAVVSAAVPPVVTSPTGLKNQSSPLGQKRPIDEVDFSLEGTSESADAKRTKL